MPIGHQSVDGQSEWFKLEQKPVFGIPDPGNPERSGNYSEGFRSSIEPQQSSNETASRLQKTCPPRNRQSHEGRPPPHAKACRLSNCPTWTIAPQLEQLALPSIVIIDQLAGEQDLDW